MKNKFLLINFLFLCLFYSHSIYPQTAKDTSYFPLAIGNKWIYEVQGTTLADTIAVVDSQTVNGKKYFSVKENSNGYLWLRKDGEKVYIVDTIAAKLDPANITEYLVYDFNSVVGQDWEVLLDNSGTGSCDYGGTIEVVNLYDRVTTGAGLFNDCFKLSHQGSCKDAGRVDEWFARGVGRVAFDQNSFAGIRKYTLKSSTIYTSVEDRKDENIPDEIKLLQNYPNPFNPLTTITFSIPAGNLNKGNAQHITLKIFDSLGREVETLVNEFKELGTYSVTWDGSKYSSGIYFYSIYINNQTLHKKMALIK